MKHIYYTQDTCSTQITFELNGDIVTDVEFTGGCSGNLKAIPKLIDGWTVKMICDKLAGNMCGRRPTSCADQLARAVAAAYAEEQNAKKA